MDINRDSTIAIVLTAQSSCKIAEVSLDDSLLPKAIKMAMEEKTPIP
jgi:hypothetical protein